MNERIKALRKYLEMNQTDFGARIGIKQSTVAAYEKGIRDPLDAVIVSICKEFKVNDIWLRTGEGEMFSPVTEEEEIASIVNQMTFKDEPAKRAAVTTIMAASETQVLLFLKELYEALEKNGIDFKKE